MIDLTAIPAGLEWPIVLLAAWIAGELGHRWAGVPRISCYALIGFAAAGSQAGWLAQPPSDPTLLLANIAFGLILFESGYRMNLRWLAANPWLTATGVTEAALTFVAVYAACTWSGLTTTTALLVAALAMATSPATIVRVINEERSSGQVTERVLHLSALNCVLAVFVFKLVVGLVVLRTSGSIGQALSSSLLVVAISAAMGGALGVAVPALLRAMKRAPHDSTLAFAITVIFLVALAHAFKQSPVLAALTFGLVVRHRRAVLSPSQRGFGALGELMSLLLFVFVAATLEWRTVVAGIGLGVLIVVVRMSAKIIGVTAFARVSGISLRKGLLTGVALAPMSVFVILVLEQTRYLGIDLVDRLSPLAAAALTLEVLGPILTRRALVWADEVPERGAP